MTSPQSMDLKVRRFKQGNIFIIMLSLSMIWPSGQGIRLERFLAWSMVEGEVESGQKERPPSLPPVEFLGSHKIFQVFVICPNLESVLSPFQVVSPLFKGSNDGQHLLVMHIIVSFYFTQAFGQKGNWMPFAIFSLL